MTTLLSLKVVICRPERTYVHTDVRTDTQVQRRQTDAEEMIKHKNKDATFIEIIASILHIVECCLLIYTPYHIPGQNNTVALLQTTYQVFQGSINI